jgi:fluoride exporter
VIVALGFAACAATGALARWWWSTRRHRRWHDHLPLPTLLVNVTWAFALGCLAGSGTGAPATTLVGTGLLGAYTTFSTFVRDTHGLVTARDGDRAALYVALSVGGGILAALAGLTPTD